jgi:hypothetical protein
VVAAAAYRAGERLTDILTLQTHDYRARSGVAVSFLVLPPAAPAQDRATLWNGAEQADARKNGRLATELELALPHELSAAQRRALVEGFARAVADRHGVAVDVSIHAPGRGGDHRNHHAHLLVTHRQFGSAGFGDLAKAFDTPAKVRAVRKEWEKAVNLAYERAGLDIRTDHRSHADRGIAQEPTQHLGPKASAIERRGAVSERGDANRAIISDNAALSVMADARDQVTAQIIDLEAARAAWAAQQEGQRAMDQAKPAQLAERQAAARDAEQRRLEAVRIAALDSDRQAAELAALESRRLEEIQAGQERAAAYLAEREKERQAEAERTRQEAQEREKQKPGAERPGELPVRDAGARYAQALGAHYDVTDPYRSLARAAMAEHGTYVREQEALRMEAAAAKDPAKRELLELRRQIESAEHLAQSGQRVARINETLTGQRDDHWREFADERRGAAVSLREQYQIRAAEQARERAAKTSEVERGKPQAESKRGFGGREQRKELLRQQREQELARAKGHDRER